MKHFAAVTVLSLWAGVVYAVDPPKSSIAVAVQDLGCTAAGANAFSITGWSFGATNSATIDAGGGAGKASVSNLEIVRQFDACSPKLLGAVLNGKHFPTLVLTQSVGK